MGVELKRVIFTFVLVLLLSAYFVNSITIFEYEETDLVSLQAEANDPDDQKLTYAYTDPLDEDGEWQTAYGDAGKYTVIITVSDGELSTSEEIIILVIKKEEKPSIETFNPPDKAIEIDEGKTLKFDIQASDLNKDPLTYSWFLNGKKVSEGNKFEFSSDYDQSGKYDVEVVISDGINNVSNKWQLKVNNVDIKDILAAIEDVTTKETGVVKLNLPDLKKYGLSYDISEPIGNDNYWLTDYDSAGKYTVTLTVEGRGFSGTEEIDVIIENEDRPSKFDIKSLYFVRENENLRIELKANDPDNDKISFSATGLPEGFSFKDNVFEWKPDYNAVQKESVFDYALDKFRLLVKSFPVTFIAVTKGGEIKKDIKVVVQDSNRPFTMEDFEDIVVNEGEIVKIQPKYDDPDNDLLSFSYSGWMNKDTHKTTYDDAGEHYVKVTATDSYHSSHKFVKIIVKKSNRKPIFSKIGNFEVNEDETLMIYLKASDPDNDEITFSVIDPPEGAFLEENIFTWKPDFDFVSKYESKMDILLNFMADDGKNNVSETSTITVLDKNRPPETIEVSKDTIADVNKPIVFWINALDKDGDELTYEWVFSRLEKYEATAVMERTFTSRGDKKVKVTVSDGEKSIGYEWDVKVV